jgi:hypothetical protein
MMCVGEKHKEVTYRLVTISLNIRYVKKTLETNCTEPRATSNDCKHSGAR